MKLTSKNLARVRSLAASGATDSEIDRAVAGGRKDWSVRRASIEARRDAGFYSRVTGESGRDLFGVEPTAKVVARIAREYPTLRRYAYPILFGLVPTARNVEAVFGASKRNATRYVGRGRPSSATLSSR